MAIKYTYSFNCTIKYRFSGETAETETPRFSDSTVLYTCTSTNYLDLNTASEIDLPLPDYLQGEEDQTQWYLSNDYTDNSKVYSGTILKTTSWTLSNKIELGTFISYDAEITLYTNHVQKTITWKYKKEDASEGSLATTTWKAIPESTAENYSSLIDSLAPTIPSFATKKEDETSTLYIFTGWGALSGESPNYTAEASYSETTFNNTLPYALNSNNPFLDAEPYHYGEGTPKSGYFIPIGEDNDATTSPDIKIQSAESNGYSKTKQLNQFKIGSRAISYIEAGTFPLLNKLSTIESASSKGTELKITYDTTTGKVKSINCGTVNCYNATDNTGTITLHGNEECPKRLGFILVGGGGGAGGGGRYDPDKDKKNSHGDFIIPGGGGGGGEIVYGVLDISYEAAKKLLGTTTPTALTYVIYVGSGGSRGEHNISSGASSGGHDGYAGKKGTDSVIYLKKNGKNEEVLKACGGGGGGGATKFTLGTGGEGGSYSNSRNVATIANTYNCAIVGAIKGGKGGHPTSTTAVANESLAFSIYFSKTVPPAEYMLSRSYAATSKTYSTDENTDPVVFNTPGGHSFGPGATSSVANKWGGGGACTGNYIDGIGTAGFFGLYY